MIGAALLLAVGLAMDATAVAAVQGLAGRETSRGLRLALLFGGFQAGMAALGWLGGRSLGATFARWDHWVAFGLLGLLGAKMLWEARGGSQADGDHRPTPHAPWRMDLTLAVATSIDALAAGVTLPLVAPPVLALIAIGVVTALASMLAYAFAMRLGKRIGARLNAVGGVVLILMGTKILVEHLRAESAASWAAVPTHDAAPALTAPAPVVARPLDDAMRAAFATMVVVDGTTTVRAHDEAAVDVAVTFASAPTLRAELELSACLACVPMQLPAWQAHLDALRTIAIPPMLRADATIALVLEVLPVDGTTMIVATHQAARLLGDDPVASHAMVGWLNDGTRQLRMIVRDIAPVQRLGEVGSSTATVSATFVPVGELRNVFVRVATAAVAAWTH